MTFEQIQEYLEDLGRWLLGYADEVLLALLILIVGFWLVRKLKKVVKLSLDRAKLAPEVNSFLASLVDISLKIVVLLMAAGALGFQLTSLVAVLAAAGFAVGLALQGNLGNFAAGITIMVFKPYKLGDWVEISERFGKVESIQIFNTTIVTPGQKVHIIPNGEVTGGVITNFSEKEHIRLELQVSMPYSESFPKVKETILESLKSVPEILQEPAPTVGIESYDSHYIIISVRPFINPDNFWDATYNSYAAIKAGFHAKGVRMAYSEGVELGDIGD